jgi:hypothetical protein
VIAKIKVRPSENAGILGLAKGLLAAEDYFVSLVSQSISQSISQSVIQSVRSSATQ